MAFSKKQLTWIFVIVAVIIITLTIWYFTRPGVPDPNKTNTPVPPGSPTPKWVPEKFPLTLGMYGTKIKALQTALGVGADGKLGPQTNSALTALGYALPLSTSDYNAIIASASASGGGTGSGTENPPPPKTKGVYAKYDNVIIRNKDLSQNRVASKDEWLGLETGTDNSGGYYELDGTYYVIKNQVYLVG